MPVTPSILIMQTTPPLIPAESNPQFHQFWEAYPRKVSKPDAQKAFSVALRQASLKDILDSLAAHKLTDQWRKNEGRFVPYPASWLRTQPWQNSLTSTTTAENSTRELSPVEKQIHHSEYLRILEEIKSIKNSYDEHRDKSREDSDKLKLLVNRRNQLRVMLNILR